MFETGFISLVLALISFGIHYTVGYNMSRQRSSKSRAVRRVVHRLSSILGTAFAIIGIGFLLAGTNQ